MNQELASAFRFQGDEDLRFLRDQLYGGSWERMLADLEARLEMRPRVHKLTANIRQDIQAIKRIMREEAERPEPHPPHQSAQHPASGEDAGGTTA